MVKLGLTLTYKNDLGSVLINGKGKGIVRLCSSEGLGVVSREYVSAVYAGQDGQKTISARALPRCITLLLEVIGDEISSVLRGVLRILSREGTLYIEDENIKKRIFCNQVQIPDVEKILKGKISSFAVQFTCDSPYFEDDEDTVLPLYGRFKRLSTPFTMPCMFGEIITGAQIENLGDLNIEPQITIYYPEKFEGAENITIANQTTGKHICLDYAPQAGEMVVIDVKSRNVISTINGNLLKYLSNDTFLGDFIFKNGINNITVDLGDVTSGFTIECRYSNLYQEAVIA